VRDNIAIGTLEARERFGFIQRRAENALVAASLQHLAIQTDSAQEVRMLSGGNQQKVLLARWLAAHPRVIVFDEPTRGIDIGAKSEIYKLLDDLAAQGKAIVMISSELPEVLHMSHRILVMCEGRITGELPGRTATEEEIMQFATQRDAEAVS